MSKKTCIRGKKDLVCRQKRPTITFSSIPEVRTSPEVDDAQDLSASDFGDEYVCGFDVSVYDPVRVQHLATHWQHVNNTLATH